MVSPSLRNAGKGGCPVVTAAHDHAQTRLTRQTVGPELKMVDLGSRAGAAFKMLGRSVAVRGPKPAALPAGIRIVDASVEILGIKVERVGNTDHDELSADHGEKRV